VGRVSTTPSLAGKDLLKKLPPWGTTQTLSVEPGPPRGRLFSRSHLSLLPGLALAGQHCSPNLDSCFSVH